MSVQIDEPVHLENEEFESDVESAVVSIEALLFVASEALSIKDLAKLAKTSEVTVATALQRITDAYSERGIIIREIGGGYRFATSPRAREAVEAYLLPAKTSLSTPALEALAIVAHMQPVTKGEIESIRGVNSDSVVSTLLDRTLIAEAGRKDVVGRPMQYKTTSFFLESFGLRSLEDLPQLELEPGQPLELDLVTAGMAQLLPQTAEEVAENTETQTAEHESTEKESAEH